MKVEYLFSKNKKSIISKAISWASSKEGFDLEEYPSHMAVLIDESIVVESTMLTGVRIIPYDHWKQKNQELYRIPCEQEVRDSQEVLRLAFAKWGSKYDKLGIMYFMWRFLGLMILDRELPAHNHWHDPSKYFCCEYAGLLAGEDFSMKTPARICYNWLKASK